MKHPTVQLVKRIVMTRSSVDVRFEQITRQDQCYKCLFLLWVILFNIKIEYL